MSENPDSRDSHTPHDAAPCIGIDLGTTHSLASIFRDGKPTLLPTAHGGVLTPSVIGVLSSGEIVVGQTAKELRVTDPDACAWCFKRYMGQDRRLRLGTKEFTPHELSSLVLRSLREDASAALGMNVTDAVITVPAYFNDHARQATRLAGEMAGLNVRRMINEPTAAALVYGFHDRDDEKNIVVIDLGGGTFDVTVMEVFEGTLEIRASAGESLLGGEDFTDRIVSEVLNAENARLEIAELNDPLRVARLRSECETAKRTLATAEHASIRVPGEDGRFTENPKKFRIDRTVFARLCDPLMQRIAGPIARALRDAEMQPDEIDEVILVGGATRMDALRKFVEDYFGKPPVMRHNPDEVVALGAAIQAALIGDDAAVDDMVMTDVCPFTLGVEVAKELGGQVHSGYFSPVLHRNCTIPISKEEIYSTMSANQTSVTVKVYQGDARKVSDNVLLGELEVSPLPPGPAGSPFFIRFTYDVSGVLEVEAYASGGQKFRTILTNHVKGLSPKSIDAARRRIGEMKFYPRDDLANQQLARYAERMLGELHPSQREQLDAALDTYEAAMNRADRAEFTATREMLMICLSSLGIHPDGADQ
ncbi:Hsp70 family protein [Allorhodopirellula heiligendammensis]|uniref:Chaperone protein HscC n=1 Tax=Allorhodopirellula heiligendammensis TaxID=2714739 RepID=A0A5C6BVQ9_9BACT|nr:molecular chaperone HscC [Allorhodopirellula heiligendammensis]TWU16370.1 Chaperone protein HscC [Allorhodopirellula heiligendammensis]